MRKPGKPTNDDFDDAELMSDGELDIDGFIDTMEEATREREEPTRSQRAGWQRVEEWREAKWLREQLDDWDDWETE